MQANFVAAPLGLLIVVAVIVGLVMLVRALPPGSGPKVALAVAGLIAFGLLFMVISYQRLHVAEQQSMVMHKEHSPVGDMVLSEVVEVRTEPSFTLLPWLIVVAVIVGLVVLFRALPQGSGPKVALGLGGVVLALMFAVFFVKDSSSVPHQMAARQEPNSIRQSGSLTRNPSQDIDSIYPPWVTSESLPSNKENPPVEPEPKSFTPPATDSQPNAKPAWLTQAIQTGNGVSQFAISSELFQTVAECQKDLDRRMPELIAAEVRYIVGEEYPIALLPGEAQGLVAETYTEEFPIMSNGTWYKVHRLIKIDKSKWATFRIRFQEAQLQARLTQLGIGLGGLLLVIGVVYLFLRRQPRVVDPTVETFSTT